MIPPDSVLATVAERLDERRLVGTRLIVEPPAYQGVTVVAELVAADGEVDRVRAEALDALFRHIDPLRGGADRTGWPFGRPVQYGEIFAVLQAVRGVRLVDEVRLFPADPLTGRRGAAADRIDVAANALVFSHQHQVVVTAAGAGDRP